MNDDRTKTPGNTLTGWLKSTLLFMVMLVLAFAMIEGLAATVLFGYDLFASIKRQTLRSGIYQEPDELLGWRTIPNLDMPDLFGPGKDFRSNERGFRNAQNFSAARPANTVRAICSGDSFTLGIGVSNENTWCSLFAAARPDVEGANLAQAGYGPGQAYLRYERDADELAHDVHIYALITDDFRRMRLARFVGTHKPYFTLQDGALSLENVPVPATSRLAVWWTLNQGIFTESNTGKVISRLKVRFSKPSRSGSGHSMQESRELARKLLERVHEKTRERNAKLVLVYLPEQATPMHVGEDWRQLMESFAAEHDTTFVDVYSHVHRLPVEQRRTLYSPEWGHFSVAGNRLVADLIWAALGDDWQSTGQQQLVTD